MYLTREQHREKMRKSLESAKLILDIIYKSQRGNIYFFNGEKKIEYFKIIGMDKDYDKTLYFNNVENNIKQAEWIFQIGRPYEFSFETATRFPLSEIKFIKDALIQVDNSVAVKVIEEIDFDNIVNPNALQYYKIVLSDLPEKELYQEKGKFVFGYKNGQRFSLKDIKKVKDLSNQHNGMIVKITETFVDEHI